MDTVQLLVVNNQSGKRENPGQKPLIIPPSMRSEQRERYNYCSEITGRCMTDETTAAILTVAHMIRIGPAENNVEAKYSHDEVLEEYHRWLGYVKNET